MRKKKQQKTTMFITTKYLDNALEKAINNGISCAIDDLGAMIKAGFDGVDMKFNRFGQGLDEVKREVSQINRRLYHAVYEPELNALERRVGRIEHKIGLSDQ